MLAALLLSALVPAADDAPKPSGKVTQQLLNSIHVTPKLIFDPFPAYVHYDRNRGSDAEILFARFRDEDVKVGRLVSAGASLKNVVKSKLGMNHGGAGDKPSTAERK